MATIPEALAIALQHHQEGRLAEAEQIYRQILAVEPFLADVHNDLGSVLRDLGELEQSVSCFRRALQLQPDLAAAQNNLGNALWDQGKMDEAVLCYRRALDLQPNHVEIQANLGNLFKCQGKLDEAVVCCRRALQCKPDGVELHSNLLLTLPYWIKTSPTELSGAYLEFDQRIGTPLRPRNPSYPNDRSPNRRLRVGYLSPDFRDHVVGYNILPLLERHDHEHYEVICYAQVLHRDEFTARFQAQADVWRNVVGLTDETLTQQVREDRIDILVDLALHTANHRLLTMARKPAPVQVTFAGYPGTTGLSTIDYRLTDPFLDPPGLNDHCYSEKSYRLPDSFWCYDSLGIANRMNPLPANERGHATFGCLNAFCKTNAQTLRLWARVLRQVECSRFLLMAPEGQVRQETLERFEQEGVSSERVSFVDWLPRPQYLELYQQIDVNLDTVPYNGHSTSLDSYWMGVPVVTLVGQSIVGRAGLSQLTNLGLTELVAHTPDEFVRIAVELAQDRPRLSQLRCTLRHRMERSPLMDASRFTQGIETAYRTMWERWCRSELPTPNASFSS